MAVGPVAVGLCRQPSLLARASPAQVRNHRTLEFGKNNQAHSYPIKFRLDAVMGPLHRAG
jgi:hypothetical protein